MSDTALVVMARYPEPGSVKTRLARGIGDGATLELYQAFLLDLVRRFAGGECDLCWAYSPAGSNFNVALAELAPELCSRWQSFPQQGADFGTRLLNAFRMTCPRPFDKTVLIASDSPHVSLATIHEARAALDEVDVVLGPAEDGGYYLIALREPHDLFSGIPMSTEVVLEMTLAKARDQGLTVRLLEPLFDVDEASDLQRLAELLHHKPLLAPATATIIRSYLKFECGALAAIKRR